MRSGVTQIGFFVLVFCLFLGYCEWWKRQPDNEASMHAGAPTHCAAYEVTGAADTSFNGIYVLTSDYGYFPCFVKETEPRRYMWRSPARWHLATSPGREEEGYITGEGASVTGLWREDGAPGPPPTISSLPEFRPPSSL